MNRLTVRINSTKEGRYQLAYKDPKTRKRVRRLFDSKTEAERAKDEIKLKMDRHVIPGGKVFVGHLVRRFVKEYPETIMLARKNSFLSFCNTFNHYEVEELTTKSLEDWFERLRKNEGFTNKTLSCVRINMNSFFKWLVREEYLPKNPILPIKFKVQKSLKRQRVILSEAEIPDMLAKLKALSSDVVYPYILVLVHTGARKNEIRQLKCKR